MKTGKPTPPVSIASGNVQFFKKRNRQNHMISKTKTRRPVSFVLKSIVYLGFAELKENDGLDEWAEIRNATSGVSDRFAAQAFRLLNKMRHTGIVG